MLKSHSAIASFLATRFWHARKYHFSGLMRTSLLVPLFFLQFSLAQAQNTEPGNFSFTPDPPQADRSFLLTILVNPCLHGGVLMNHGPLDREIVVTPGRIDVTVLYLPTGGGVCQPGLVSHFNSIQIDPVSAGTYELTVYGRDASNPDDPAYIVPRYQTSVTVVEQSLAIPQPVMVPSLSPPVLGLLAGLMLLLGALAWRRQG